jgi:hypothetical protein
LVINFLEENISSKILFNCSNFPGSNNHPFSLASTIDGTPPTFVAIMGYPADIHSKIEIGTPSK